jgi:CRISPR system Cascade subunit CasE
MTQYLLTKATIAPVAANLGTLLAENGAVDGGHKLVWTLFPASPDAAIDAKTPRDFLYRAVDDRTYFVLSRRPPEDQHKLWQMGSKPYQLELQAGERYSFILRANPVMAIRSGNGKSTRVDAVMHAKTLARKDGNAWTELRETEAALAWLMHREDHLGVTFDRDATRAERYSQVRIPRRGSPPVRFSTIDYDGSLEVKDPVRFHTALVSGVGKARAFGCGLMLIRRAQ